MSRIKIEDLSKIERIGREEMKKVMGGTFCFSLFPFAIRGFMGAAPLRYESSTEGADPQEDQQGLKSEPHD